MSCKVLVIPEDPTFNGYILKPLVEKILEESGKAKAQVLVLRNPKTGGFSQAWALIATGDLRARYGHYDLWLFLPDGDQAKDLGTLEAIVKDQKAPLIASYLTPEVEAVLMAGHPKANRNNWQEKRQHPHFKEAIFAPFLADEGNPTAPGQGRETLMREALRNYGRIKQLMPEVEELESRISLTLKP